VINSRAKGCRGEREFAEILQGAGFDARRSQQFAGGHDSEDLIHSVAGVHFEVKNTQNLRLYEAYRQACEDCSKGKIPVVAHKRNHGKWMVTLSAEDYLSLLSRVKVD
jgi:Holliday junction resolvase